MKEPLQVHRFETSRSHHPALYVFLVFRWMPCTPFSNGTRSYKDQASSAGRKSSLGSPVSVSTPFPLSVVGLWCGDHGVHVGGCSVGAHTHLVASLAQSLLSDGDHVFLMARGQESPQTWAIGAVPA